MGAKLCCTRRVHQPPSKKNLLADQHDRWIRFPDNSDDSGMNIRKVNNDRIPDNLDTDVPDNGGDIPNELENEVSNNDAEKQNTKVTDVDQIPENLNIKVADKCNDFEEDSKPKAGDKGEDILVDLDIKASDTGNNIRDDQCPKSLNLPNVKTPEIPKAEAGGINPSGLEVNMYMNDLGDVFTSAAPLLDKNSSLGLANSNSFSPGQKETSRQQLRVDT